MTERSFVDTNVWVYAVDDADPAKRQRARAILAPSRASDLVISAQVLGEFYVTVTRKLARPVPDDRAEAMIHEMARLPVVGIDPDLVATAITSSRGWHISYWDALVIAAAAAAGCSTILTEDLADGARYGAVRVDNPFRPGHRLSETKSRGEDRVSTDRGASRRGSWDEEGLREELAGYEQVCRDAGMRPNAIHSYWDYARRFLDWRAGIYQPRGTEGGGRPVPLGPVTADELARQAEQYSRAIEAAGRAPDTSGTYLRHALFFVRWLRGEFRPGRRLRGA